MSLMTWASWVYSGLLCLKKKKSSSRTVTQAKKRPRRRLSKLTGPLKHWKSRSRSRSKALLRSTSRSFRWKSSKRKSKGGKMKRKSKGGKMKRKKPRSQKTNHRFQLDCHQYCHQTNQINRINCINRIKKGLPTHLTIPILMRPLKLTIQILTRLLHK